MYEHRTAPLLSRHAFRRRLIRHAAYALLLLLSSMILGVIGFSSLAQQSLVDAILNSGMLLGGMGPVGEIRSTPGKLFATFYALYAGLAFLGIGTIVIAPIFHRLLHTFHLEEQERKGRDAGSK